MECGAVVCKSQIDILASLVHPRSGHKWRNRFVMVEAYLDESGIHKKARVCVVAGFYANQVIWRKFEGQWNSIINDYPEIIETGFHAKRFFARADGKRVSPYTNWPDEKADKFLNRLVQCVMRNPVSPIAFGVVVQDFLALSEIDRKWLTGAQFSLQGKPITSGCSTKSYYLPFQFCIFKSAQMSSAAEIDKIHVFVGLDRTFHAYAADLYKNLQTDPRLPESLVSLLGTLSNPLAKDTPGLQAADLLAYQFYQRSLQILSKPLNPLPAILKDLTKNQRINQKFTLFNSVWFEHMRNTGTELYSKLRESGQLQQYLKSLRR